MRSAVDATMSANAAIRVPHPTAINAASASVGHAANPFAVVTGSHGATVAGSASAAPATTIATAAHARRPSS
jgi:hypothetical protein